MIIRQKVTATRGRFLKSIFPALANREGIAPEIASTPFLDLSVTYRVIMKKGSMQGSSRMLSAADLETLGVSLEWIHEKALENLRREGGMVVFNDFLMLPPVKVYAITSRHNLYGAAVMLAPDAVEGLDSISGNGLFLIPSSVHEWVATPYMEGVDTAGLIQIIRVINKYSFIVGIVGEDEVLGDTVYLYRDGKMSIAAKEVGEPCM